MVGNFRVVTLCGSTKFKEEFLGAQKRLTLDGVIVISVGLFGHSGDTEAMSEDTKTMLDDMHKRKIDLADSIYVINKNGYIGSSTKNEIAYAVFTGKDIQAYDMAPEALVSIKNVIDNCHQNVLSAKINPGIFDTVIEANYGFNVPYPTVRIGRLV